MVLVGKVQAEINNVFVVTATSLQINGDRPVNVKYGPQGTIGVGLGCEKVSASITLAVPVTGLELDVVGALDAPEGFSITFPIGAEKHALYNCYRSKRGFQNNPEAGDTTFTIDVVASDWIRVA